MKAGLIRLVVAGMMITGVCAAVAQQVAPAAAPKAKETAKTALRGVLSAPATNAVAGVVAVLTHKEKDGSVKTYNLTCADADIVAKIADGVAKSANAVVRGEPSKDGTSFAVTSFEIPKHHEKPAAAPAAAGAPPK